MGFDGFSWIRGIAAWGKSTNSCSAESHVLIYLIVVMALLISVGGVFVWRRFIRTQPAALVGI
jgi:phosphate/sulfate permease